MRQDIFAAKDFVEGASALWLIKAKWLKWATHHCSLEIWIQESVPSGVSPHTTSMGHTCCDRVASGLNDLTALCGYGVYRSGGDFEGLLVVTRTLQMGKPRTQGTLIWKERG